MARRGPRDLTRPRPAPRRRARPDPARGRRHGQPRAAAARAAGRRCLQPDPRPRPDGGPLRGRRTPQGHRQPRPRRHRRDDLFGDRCGPRATPVVAGDRADGRRDVPARHDRLVPRPARGAPGPDDRRGERRRRVDLRHPGAGGAGVRRSLRHPLRHSARRGPRQPLRRGPCPTCGSPACPSSSRRSRCPTVASRSSRHVSGATTARTSTNESARWPPDERGPTRGCVVQLRSIRAAGSPTRGPSRRTCAAGASCRASPAPRSPRPAGSG